MKENIVVDEESRRFSLAVEILIGIGLSIQKASQIMQADVQTVRRTCKSLGGKEALRKKYADYLRYRVYPNCSEEHNPFQLALMRYARETNLDRNYYDHQNNPDRLVIMEIVGKVIDIESLETFIIGIEEVEKRLVVPQGPMGPYENFLKDVFVLDVSAFSFESGGYVARSFWKYSYLDRINNAKIPVPGDYKRLVKDLADKYVEAFRPAIVPIWQDYVPSLVDWVLYHGLSEIERTFIRCYYGIGAKKKNFRQIASDFGFTTSSVRNQVEAILAKIREDRETFKVLHILWGSGDTVKDAVADFFPTEIEFQMFRTGEKGHVEQSDLEGREPFSYLFRSIKFLDIDSRMANLLRSLGDELIGEVVSRSREDLLKSGFGSTGVEILERALSKIGLSLDLRVTAEFRALLMMQRINLQKLRHEEVLTEEQLISQELRKNNKSLFLPVEKLDLSARACNRLLDAKLYLVGDIVQTREWDFQYKVKYDKKIVQEVRDMLIGMGLDYGMHLENRLQEELCNARLELKK